MGSVTLGADSVVVIPVVCQILNDGRQEESPVIARNTKHLELSAGTLRYQESGEGPPIVFVQGLFNDGQIWRKVVPELSKDFKCVTVDWPLGAHKQPMKPSADLTPPGVARLVVELLEALDLRDVTLVGNDTGGAVVQ